MPNRRVDPIEARFADTGYDDLKVTLVHFELVDDFHSRVRVGSIMVVN